jgi:tRNA-dihydrouridine synthase
MIGRGAYGRPWIAAAIDRALAANDDAKEPSLTERLSIVLDHLADSMRFYGDVLGLKIFRKHLGWYIEQAPSPTSADRRRAARGTLCRMESAREVESALQRLWNCS